MGFGEEKRMLALMSIPFSPGAEDERAEILFFEALKFAPDEREAFLQRECAAHTPLRAHVADLLRDARVGGLSLRARELFTGCPAIGQDSGVPCPETILAGGPSGRGATSPEERRYPVERTFQPVSDAGADHRSHANSATRGRSPLVTAGPGRPGFVVFVNVSWGEALSGGGFRITIRYSCERFPSS